VDRVAGFGVPVEFEARVRADGPAQSVEGPVRARGAERVGAPEPAGRSGQVDVPEPAGRSGQVEVPVRLAATRRRPPGARSRTTAVSGRSGPELPVPSFDLLNLPRPAAHAPWAYVKVAEGCDRRCGFCAIPSFRGPQRSRLAADILGEVEDLGVQEVVLVAQDLVSWDRDLSGPGRGAARLAKSGGAGDAGGSGGAGGAGPGEISGLVRLVRAVRERVERVRLLYLYPSGLSGELVEAIGEGGCPYFDLSLQHVSGPLLRRMRRVGNSERFLGKISDIRHRFPEAALRSSFIVGYPGETEDDHDALLRFLEEAQLDWVGLFAFSLEDGTYAAELPGQVPAALVAERLRECSELQDAITARKRAELVGTNCWALVDAPGLARSHREAPEIDGVIKVPRHLAAGSWVELEIVDAIGPDLVGAPAADTGQKWRGSKRNWASVVGLEPGTTAAPALACNLSAGV